MMGRSAARAVSFSTMEASVTSWWRLRPRCRARASTSGVPDPLPEALDHPSEDLLHPHALGHLVGVGEEVALEGARLDPEAPGQHRVGGHADDLRGRRDALGLELAGELPDREPLGEDEEMRLHAPGLEELQDGEERRRPGAPRTRPP